MTEGVDYAWSRPDPATLYAAGKRFASRYLSYDRSGKNLTLAEAEQLAAAGISVVANWEWQTGDAKGGYDVGRKYAQEAVRQAAACGMPAGRPIYFSVDYDPAGAYAIVDAYFRGIGSVLPVEQIGAYGGYDTIAHLLDFGLIWWAWQTYAWSAGRWHPGAHVQQYRNGVLLAGGDLDLDRAMVDDFGQWTPGKSFTTKPENGDDEMQLLVGTAEGKFWAGDGFYHRELADENTAQTLAKAAKTDVLNYGPATTVAQLLAIIGPTPYLVQSAGGDKDSAAIIAAVRGEADAVKAEVRDAVADLAEGGSAAVRADPDA